jgi:16S rRNA G966 N2-methylase RsmD
LKHKKQAGSLISEHFQLIIEQIASLQKAKYKLPEFYSKKNIIFPPKISLEQCSSEATALLKSQLIKGKTLVDLTGGFGIDVAFFAREFEEVEYVERNTNLVEIVKHNFNTLGIKNVRFYKQDSEDFLKENLVKSQKTDVVYLDPARRNPEQKKIFQLSDCQPDVLDLKASLLKLAKKIVIKTSPILDIHSAIKQLENVEKIWVVSVQNECKEVLYQIGQNRTQNPEIEAISLSKNNPPQHFVFNFEEEKKIIPTYSLAQKYIYEPDVSLLKAGAFKSIAKHWKLNKLHPNSQVYTSEELKEDFMGRVFLCKKVLKFDKKILNKEVQNKQANIICRNFPLSVAQIRKKTGIKEGGSTYLMATTDSTNKKIILLLERLN